MIGQLLEAAAVLAIKGCLVLWNGTELLIEPVRFREFILGLVSSMVIVEHGKGESFIYATEPTASDHCP